LDNKRYWRETLEPFTKKSNAIAYRQIALTIIPFIFIWLLYIKTIHLSNWLVLPYSIVMSLFTLRFFVLLHDCGHGALFDSVKLNKFFGYVFGVITGMPQYVWSKHHAYHHTTNGDWEKYKGPLNVKTKKEFQAMSGAQQRKYRAARHPLFLLTVGGFYYVLFNPRFTWMMGTLSVFKNIFFSLFNPKVKTLKVLTEWKAKYWKTPKEYRHMTYNNLTLLPIWYFMCQAIGTGNFFLFYATTLTLTGGLGILFFTVQHNFENSLANDTARADYFKAAIEGTSYLKLPAFLNWFTADIAYHHVHHLSTSVPNYNLKACHNQLKDKFTNVKRVSLKEIPDALNYMLWDTDNQVITK
jgi:omega-6 fatty acid desaturase (delta-12 desaturase)